MLREQCSPSAMQMGLGVLGTGIAARIGGLTATPGAPILPTGYDDLRKHLAPRGSILSLPGAL